MASHVRAGNAREAQMTRTLTLPERRLIVRALLHLHTEYTRASLAREQTGDGRSARMRAVRNAIAAQELALLVESAGAIELSRVPQEFV